jgi:hypothetical protein
MEISKQQGTAAPCAGDGDELACINRFARTPLTAEQVYCFAVRLCDNEVDRDFERFDEAALSTLGDLFVGKTGIFDHQWSAEGQTARIYRTELVREPERRTAAGDGGCWLKGWAYLLRSDKNAELIREIEGGIKKEVSVGCAVRRSVCSVCGAESGTCEHIRGREYGGKLCFAELREPTDAYEWSFVAVPAQRDAGVVKKFTGGAGSADLRELEHQARLGRTYLAGLRREVVRLAMLADDTLDGAFSAGWRRSWRSPSCWSCKRATRPPCGRAFPFRPSCGTSPPRPETTRAPFGCEATHVCNPQGGCKNMCRR